MSVENDRKQRRTAVAAPCRIQTSGSEVSPTFGFMPTFGATVLGQRCSLRSPIEADDQAKLNRQALWNKVTQYWYRFQCALGQIPKRWRVR